LKTGCFASMTSSLVETTNSEYICRTEAATCLRWNDGSAVLLLAHCPPNHEAINRHRDGVSFSLWTTHQWIYFSTYMVCQYKLRAFYVENCSSSLRQAIWRSFQRFFIASHQVWFVIGQPDQVGIVDPSAEQSTGVPNSRRTHRVFPFN